VVRHGEEPGGLARSRIERRGGFVPPLRASPAPRTGRGPPRSTHSRYDPIFSLDVLRRREGDGTEHALLAAALCRAAGVPARVVVGLAYAGDQKRVFGFHAWIEAWCGRWTAMDPAWDEPLADATHLRLAEGSDPYALLPFLGEIRIRVLEVEME